MLRNTKDIWLDLFRKGLKAWTMIRMGDKSARTKTVWKYIRLSRKPSQVSILLWQEIGERTNDNSGMKRTWKERTRGVELEEFCHKNRFSSGGRWPEEGWYRERENSRGYRCWWYCTVADIKMLVIDVCTVLSGTALRYTRWQWGGQWEISPYAPY